MGNQLKRASKPACAGEKCAMTNGGTVRGPAVLRQDSVSHREGVVNAFQEGWECGKTRGDSLDSVLESGGFGKGMRPMPASRGKC